MIRGKDKVYGERNDPETVIAVTPLEDGYPVVGAGNHGVKTVNLGPKRLLYGDTLGKLTGLPFNTPNKVIGTNAQGELTLLDMPNFNTNFALIDLEPKSVSCKYGTVGEITMVNDGDFTIPYTSHSAGYEDIIQINLNNIIIPASATTIFAIGAVDLPEWKSNGFEGNIRGIIFGVYLGRDINTSYGEGLAVGGAHFNKSIDIIKGTVYNKLFIRVSPSVGTITYKLRVTFTIAYKE